MGREAKDKRDHSGEFRFPRCGGLRVCAFFCKHHVQWIWGASLSVCKVMVYHLPTQLTIHRASGAVHSAMCSGGLPSDCVLFRGFPKRLLGSELREESLMGNRNSMFGNKRFPVF